MPEEEQPSVCPKCAAPVTFFELHILEEHYSEIVWASPGKSHRGLATYYEWPPGSQESDAQPMTAAEWNAKHRPITEAV